MAAVCSGGGNDDVFICLSKYDVSSWQARLPWQRWPVSRDIDTFDIVTVLSSQLLSHLKITIDTQLKQPPLACFMLPNLTVIGRVVQSTVLCHEGQIRKTPETRLKDAYPCQRSHAYSNYTVRGTIRIESKLKVTK